MIQTIETEYGPVEVKVIGLTQGSPWRKYLVKFEDTTGAAWACYPPDTDLSELRGRLALHPELSALVTDLKVLDQNIQLFIPNIYVVATAHPSLLDLVETIILDLPVTRELATAFALEGRAMTLGEM